MGVGQRKQVQLVQILNPRNSEGRPVETEGQKFGVWAEVSSPSGSRDYQNGQTQLQNTKRFLIRFRFDRFPNANWKIRYEGKDWTISTREAIDEKRFYWQFTASSKADV